MSVANILIHAGDSRDMKDILETKRDRCKYTNSYGGIDECSKHTNSYVEITGKFWRTKVFYPV